MTHRTVELIPYDPNYALLEGKYGVYEYGEYGRESVLAGQSRRQFLGSHDTLLAAIKAAGPGAEICD